MTFNNNIIIKNWHEARIRGDHMILKNVRQEDGIKAYKFLNMGLGTYSHFNYRKYLPYKDEPGRVLPYIESRDLQMCRRGYHACTVHHLAWWMKNGSLGDTATELYEVKLWGTVHFDCNSTKLLANRMQFVKKIDKWNEDIVQPFLSKLAENEPWLSLELTTFNHFSRVVDDTLAFYSSTRTMKAWPEPSVFVGRPEEYNIAWMTIYEIKANLVLRELLGI